MKAKTIMTIALVSAAAILNAVEKPVWVYLGSYAKGEDQGITLCELDRSNGKLKKLKVFGGHPNPSFLEIHPSKKFLYAVNEIGDYEGKKAGSVTAFSIDSKTGDLTQLNQLSSICCRAGSFKGIENKIRRPTNSGLIHCLRNMRRGR